MPRGFFKRHLPDPKTLLAHRHLRYLGDVLHDPNLWHLNRNSIATAFSIGLFCAFMPIPFQMLLAAILAIVFRANILVSVILVWISNPITMPALFYGAYKVGAWVLWQPAIATEWQFGWTAILEKLGDILPALLVGAFICGTIAALLGNLCIRLIWRWFISKKWRQRRSY